MEVFLADKASLSLTLLHYFQDISIFKMATITRYGNKKLSNFRLLRVGWKLNRKFLATMQGGERKAVCEEEGNVVLLYSVTSFVLRNIMKLK